MFLYSFANISNCGYVILALGLESTLTPLADRLFTTVPRPTLRTFATWLRRIDFSSAINAFYKSAYLLGRLLKDNTIGFI